MKKLYLILPIIILLSYGGCGDDGSNDFFCSFELMQNRFADTDCIAEEFIIGCTNIFCRGENADAVNLEEQCVVIDCQTLSCDRISMRVGNMFSTQPGMMADLFISETNGLPAGTFVVDGQEIPFTCAFIN